MTPKGESLVDCYYKWRSWADGEVCCDYGLHSLVSCWKEGVTEREMEQLAMEEGRRGRERREEGREEGGGMKEGREGREGREEGRGGEGSVEGRGGKGSME